MIYRFPSLLLLVLSACSAPSSNPTTFPSASSEVTTVIIPDGFTMVDVNPDGYFIRLSSPRPASRTEIRRLVESLDGRFDRIDLCIDGAHERGDEYASVIDGQLFDFTADRIIPLKDFNYD